MWTRREQAYEEIREAADTIDANIRGIIEKVSPTSRAKVVSLPRRT